MRVLLSVFFFLEASLSAHAASVRTFETGEYIRDEGTGNLVLGPEKSGVRHFTIDTVGSNAHQCGLEGDMKNGVAILKEDDDDKDVPACVINFTIKDDGILVEPKNLQDCHYCGSRASFDGLFRKSIPECLSSAVKNKRHQAGLAFKNKDYAQARDLLQPLVGKCDKYLDIFDHAWLRNDLALSLHKLNDQSGCIKTLEPLKDSIKYSDEEIRSQNLAGTDARIKLAKATRHNLKLCQPAQ